MPDDAAKAHAERAHTAALGLYERGLRPVPLEPNGVRINSKILGGVYYDDRSYLRRHGRLEEIQAWLECTSRFNLGLATGSTGDSRQLSIVAVVVRSFDSSAARRVVQQLDGMATPNCDGQRWRCYLFTSRLPVDTEKTAWGFILGEGATTPVPPSIFDEHELRWRLTPDSAKFQQLPFRLLNEWALDDIGRDVASSEASSESYFYSEEERERSLLATGSPLAPEGFPISPEHLQGKNLLRGKKLRNFDRYDDVVERCWRVLKIPTTREDFPCILPHPRGVEPHDARLIRNQSGEWVYWCSCGHSLAKRGGGSREEGEVRQAFVLGELLALLTCETMMSLQWPEIAVWHVRLLYEARVLDLPRPPPLKRNPRLSDADMTVLDGLILLIRCRVPRDDGKPFPFTLRFVARWCGVTQREASDAIQKLKSEGYLTLHHTETGKGGQKPTPFYLPGPKLARLIKRDGQPTKRNPRKHPPASES